MSVNIAVRPGIADLAAIQQARLQDYPFLLESVNTDQDLSRYSILFAQPGKTISCSKPSQADKFLESLDSQFAENHELNRRPERSLPFHGGWFIYLGYEVVQGIEPSLHLPDFSFEFPVAFATRCHAAIIVDHLNDETICFSESADASLLHEMLRDLEIHSNQSNQIFQFDSLVEENPDNYLTGIEKILEYIRAGDVFQVNLSREWKARVSKEVSSSYLYNRLRTANPAPFACHIHHELGSIISSSPERLVKVDKGKIETRPIAGTRPRTHNDQDVQWLEELRTDRKERAEHIMLIDLERNDLGRVCKPGTIQVDELMTLESYEYVHHIVSNIRGDIGENVTPFDVIRAVFPGGTITGCPKVRCMEIINELEQQGRGPYTGSVGYINHDGSMDMNILIRTIFKQENNIHFRAGAGIVADSIPEKELDETRQKARGLLKALQS